MKNRLPSKLEQHPCFNAEAKGSYGRVHLPVAPKCNIKCNFCDRKYDCVNESRPGVTSSVLTPAQAGLYLEKVLAQEPRITVAGIAGPGDPFANGLETMATLRTIREKHEHMLLCVSTNGLGIHPYIEELAEIGVSHVTVTVCSVDPGIGSQIYSWVRDGKIVYRGLPAAQLLLERQLEAIAGLKNHGLTVKVNCIVIPGINDRHIEDVAREMKRLGVDLFNCMAMFPNVNTLFGTIRQPDKKMITEIRAKAERYLPQMKHCTRCRADAVGLLNDDRTEEFRSCLTSCATVTLDQGVKRPYIAVASREGVLINQHLGEARNLQIWQKTDTGYARVENRGTPPIGGGIKRWHQLARILGDCRAVLVSGIGRTPSEILLQSGVKPIEASGFIEDGLHMVFHSKKSSLLRGRKKSSAGICSGSGSGCD